MLPVELKTCSLTLNITINQNILNYILYIKSKDEESFVKQSFLMSFDLYCNGKSSFHSHLMEMSEYFNLSRGGSRGRVQGVRTPLLP